MGAQTLHNNKPSVSSAYVRAIYNAAVAAGIDLKDLGSILGGDVKSLEIGTRRYAPSVVLEMFELAARHLNSPSIGIAFGAQIRPERRLDVIYATSFCQTLRQAIELNIAYQPLIQSIGRTRLEINGDSGRCVWTTEAPPRVGLNILKETIFAGYASIGRWLVWADSLPILQMSFRGEAPANIQPYKNLFGPNVIFGADEDALTFASETLELPIPSRNADILARLTANLDIRLAALNSPQNIVADVLAVINAQMTTGSLSIGNICEKMDIKERTLRRKLTQMETSFSELLAQARQETATIYMMDKNISLAEIAQALGFNDQSAFSRAFKDWTGKTPKAYRQSILKPSL